MRGVRSRGINLDLDGVLLQGRAAGHLELASKAMLLLDILTAKPALGGLHTRGN